VVENGPFPALRVIHGNFGATFIGETRIASRITNHAETALFEIVEGNPILGAIRGVVATIEFCSACSAEVTAQGLIIVP
jgi:hypothetical protein